MGKKETPASQSRPGSPNDADAPSIWHIPPEKLSEIRQKIDGATGQIRIQCPNPGCTGSQNDTFSIDAATGAFQCFRCGVTGNVYSTGEKTGTGKQSTAEYLWNQANPAAEHPYLTQKGVKSYGLKVDKHGNLVVPLSISGKLSTLQFVKPSGDKILLSKAKGGKKKGAYFQVGTGAGNILYINEGYATAASVYEATNGACFMVVDAGNLKPAAENLRRIYPAFEFVFCADNDRDKSGTDANYNVGYLKAVEAARQVGGKVCMPEQAGFDFNDLHVQHGIEAVMDTIGNAAAPPPATGQVTPLNLHEILTADIPERDYLLRPFLPTQGLVLVYAPRGIGKTYFLLSCGLTIAAGASIFNWQAPAPARVLYADGEMPGKLMQERITAQLAGMDATINPDYFRIITPDLSGTLPNLAAKEGQRVINDMADSYDVVILDNLSTLIDTGKESGSDEWQAVQGWLLELRRRGKSVVLVHHAGKSGMQRGTSRREDVLDTVIGLKRPKNYNPEDGACFEVHFEKARGVYGLEVQPFEAKLIGGDGALEWTWRPLDDAEYQLIKQFLDDGYTLRQIADETGLSKSAVHRLIKKFQG